MSKFKLGDAVVGNERANIYAITVQGWEGIVTYVSHDEKYIKVKAAYGHNLEDYAVCADMFDLKNIVSTSVVKQQLLDKLSLQDDCYYSLEQVMNMIKSIEDSKPTMTDMVSVLEEDFDDVLNEIYDLVEEKISTSSQSDLVDLDSAEFELNGDRISLDRVDVDSREIADIARESVKKILSEYVTIIEKSEEL